MRLEIIQADPIPPEKSAESLRAQGEMARAVSRRRLVRAFNEWMRRYTDEPELFAREFQQVGEFLAQVASGEEPSYGASAAAYLTEILDGLDPFDVAIEQPNTTPSPTSAPAQLNWADPAFFGIRP